MRILRPFLFTRLPPGTWPDPRCGPSVGVPWSPAGADAHRERWPWGWVSSGCSARRHPMDGPPCPGPWPASLLPTFPESESLPSADPGLTDASAAAREPGLAASAAARSRSSSFLRWSRWSRRRSCLMCGLIPSASWSPLLRPAVARAWPAAGSGSDRRLARGSGSAADSPVGWDTPEDRGLGPLTVSRSVRSTAGFPAVAFS